MALSVARFHLVYRDLFQSLILLFIRNLMEPLAHLHKMHTCSNDGSNRIHKAC